MVNILKSNIPLINYKQMGDKNFEKNRNLNFSVFHPRFLNHELRTIYNALGTTEQYGHLHKGALHFVPMHFILDIINAIDKELTNKIKYMLRWHGIKF